MDSVDESSFGQPPPKLRADTNPVQPKKTRHGRRLQRIREEIERNRTKGPAIPTGVLALTLVVIIGLLALVIAIS